VVVFPLLVDERGYRREALMKFPGKAKRALKKVLQANAEYQDSLRGGADNSEKRQQLASAVKVAADDFFGVAASLWPEFRTLRHLRKQPTNPVVPNN